MHPGFPHPVLDAQQCFRGLLEVMSRPGTIQTVTAHLQPPPSLERATAACLLTLLDADTGLYADVDEQARSWLQFHCGCPMVSLEEADFVLVTGEWPSLHQMKLGQDEEPETSATLICQVRSLRSDAGWKLSGPGIEDAAFLAVEQPPRTFLAEWQAQQASFPRGTDIILCSGDRIAALPRTVCIEEV
ncbi:phosphonate C-P lyase system protein PhnH [Pseudoroseomonas globiformis]|uniref:Phosphonate C-P lyase system protein PhnH n=1 Tax=Teichococcus globiformis TaxID=2307229 RepID=A0ABV7FZI6_9PROT